MIAASLPEWITAVATCAATAAATAAGWVAFRSHLREVNRDRAKDAAGIHAWFAWDVAADGSGQCLIVVNVGASPVYEVVVHGVLNATATAIPRETKTWQVLPPGAYVIRPHETYRWTLPEPVPTTVGFRPYTRSDNHRVTRLEFRDAAGNRWSRDGSGRLESVD